MRPALHFVQPYDSTGERRQASQQGVGIGGVGWRGGSGIGQRGKRHVGAGVLLPAHLTATGRAMLAALPASQIRALYPTRDSLVRRVGPGPATLAELDTLLLRTRERGWAAEQGDVMADYSSVGAAALDHKGYPIAAIGVTFRSGITDDAVDALGSTVVTAAAALGARALGRA